MDHRLGQEARQLGQDDGAHRGGKRSHTGSQGRTKQQLYNEAKQRNIKGRSSRSRAELEKALAR